MKRYPHYLIDLARQFRKRATPAEAALWEQLRSKKLEGFKFVRQFHVERYVVDFCRREQKLVVEFVKWKLRRNMTAFDLRSWSWSG